MAESQPRAPDMCHRLTALRTLQKEQEEHEQYLAAEVTKEQIVALDEAARREAERSLSEQMEVNKGELQLAHNREFEEFRKTWEQRLAAYRNTAGQLESALRARHVVSLEAEIRQFTQSLPTQAKPSASLLAAIHQKDALVKAQNYKEAQIMVGRIAEIERRDAEMLVKTVQERVEQERKKAVGRQNLELEALRHRHELGYKELLRQRESELERLSKKFRNNACDLVTQQGLLKSRSDTRMRNLPLATKRIERILTSARSSHNSPLVSPRSMTRKVNSRCGSPRRGDGEF